MIFEIAIPRNLDQSLTSPRQLQATTDELQTSTEGLKNEKHRRLQANHSQFSQG